MLKVTKISTVVLFFYILFYQQVWGDNHLILYGAAGITILSIVIYWMREGFLSIDLVPYGIWNNLILILYAVMTGIFVSRNFMTTLQTSITILAFAAVCIAMCYVSAEEGSFEWILKIMVALALLCSLYTFIRGTEWPGYGIVLSATNNPHDLAAVLNIGVFSVLYLSRNRTRKFSLFSSALILLFTIVTIRCGSRKYLIANVLIEGIWAWTIVREEWKSGDSNRRAITVLVFIAFAGIAYYIVRNVYMTSDSHLRMQNSMDMGNQYRILFYKESWKIFLDHPFFGGGLNQFQYLSTVATGNYAHSTYAEAIADFGLVGCVLYFAPIIAVSYRIIRKTLNSDRNYGDYLLLALCLSELFIGTGQIFFMEFYHFIAWSILFFYGQPTMDSESKNIMAQQNIRACKYIR